MQFNHFQSARVRKRGNTWQGVLSYKDQDGKWLTKSKSFSQARLKRDALACLEEWREQEELNWQESRGRASFKALTVSEYASHYIDTLEKTQTVSKTTVNNYRFRWLAIDRSHLNQIPLEEISAEDAERFIATLLESGKKPATVRIIFNVLHAAIKHAVEAHRLKYDPIACVKLPKIAHNEPNVLAKEQLDRLVTFLEESEDNPLCTAIALALYTGMREGEACGLRWEDIDFENGVIKVRRSIANDMGRPLIKEPKTRSSRRSIPLTPALEARLIYRQHEAEAACRIAGVPFVQSMYVTGGVGDGTGSLMLPRNLGRQWKTLAQALNLKGTQGKPPTFHDLRHTYATVAIANGSDVKSVQALLGHASAKVTLDTYATTDDEAIRRAALNTASAIKAHATAGAAEAARKSA